MTPVLNYTYFRVSKTDGVAVSALKYRDLRLRGLKASPSSFASTYETEAAFSDNDWIQRLSSPDCETFICAATAPSQTDAPGAGEWVGQVTLRGPMSVSEFALADEAGQSEVNLDDEERWQVLGLFLLPEHRGGGRGSKLCREALDYLQQRASSVGKVHVRLMVKPDNQPIVQLYQRLGFVQTGNCTLAEAIRAGGDGHLLPSDTSSPKYSTRAGLIMNSHLQSI